MDNEALKEASVAGSKMLSALARINEIRGFNFPFAEPVGPDAAEPAPPLTNGTEKNAEEPNAEVKLETAFVYCSGKVFTSTQEAQTELPMPEANIREDRASFETLDSALGESVSEANVQRQKTPVSPSAIIVKFSTTSPGRINGVERRGPAHADEQAPSSSADQCNSPSQPQKGPASPDSQGQKRRGRPLGSKNKNPSRRRDHQGISPTQSEIMRKIWEKRRNNGTDGHGGGPPSEETLQKRERKYAPPVQSNGLFYGAFPGSTQPQLFNRHPETLSASGTRLPTLAPRPASTMQPTVNQGLLNTSLSRRSVRIPRPIVGPPSPSELPHLCHGDLALTAVFVRCAYRTLVSSRDHYQGNLPNETLIAISKKVANDTVNQKFQGFLQGYNYQLDSRQRRLIRKYIRQSFAAEVRHAREEIQSKSAIASVDQEPNVSDSKVPPAGNENNAPTVAANAQSIESSLLAAENDLDRLLGFGLADETKPNTPLIVTDRERSPAERDCSDTTFGNPSLSRQRKGLSPAFILRGCIECRSRKRKCVLQGTSCLACKTGGKDCKFRPGDLEHNLKLINSGDTVKDGVVRSRGSEYPPIKPSVEASETKKPIPSIETPKFEKPKPSVKVIKILNVPEIRSCVLCRQKKKKCIPRGTSCVLCKAAGTKCFLLQADLDHNRKILSEHRRSSAPEQAAFTGHITQHDDPSPQDHDHRVESFSEPLRVDDRNKPPLGLTHPDDRSAHSLDRECSKTGARPHNAVYKAGPTASSLQSLSRRPSDSQPGKLSGTVQRSPKKLRGHVQAADDGIQIDWGHSEEIDWYRTLYTCQTLPQTQDNTTPKNLDDHPSTDLRSRPSTFLLPQPATAFHPELELAFASATLCEEGGDRPYKSLKRGHYDFVRQEYISLLHILDSLDRRSPQDYTADAIELRRQLQNRLGEHLTFGEAFPEDKMTAIIKAAHSGKGTALARRKRKNIRAFVIDVVEHSVPPFSQPRLAKPRIEVSDLAPKSRSTISSLLRNRELGLGDSARNANLQAALSTQIAENIRPWRSWKGASSDVVTVAWAPDSLSYATGAAAQSDENVLQYNRSRNLLFGNLTSNTIYELPDHSIERPKPETITSGPNSTYAVYQACDPLVYKTVTSVQFAPQGGMLYTASHDKTVKIWDITEERPSCWATLNHKAEVTSLEVSNYYPQHFATASKTIDDSVRVYWPAQNGSQSTYQALNFSSSRALKHRDHDIFPECIRWGLAPGTKHLLLAGYQQWADHDFSAARQGQICLWDLNTEAEITIRPHASAIFSIAWHPRDNIFVTGGAPGNGPLSYPRTTKSVVRSYDIRGTSSYTHEFECPALDIQDVTFHPNNSSYVTAGCTDGTTYVWDYRWPDDIMHRLHHGEPLQELAVNEEDLPHIQHREKVDAGVMLSIWGKGASRLYTGSSDGVIKAWDILRAPEDVWVRDIARLPAGVQSGALSPDRMNMLVGDAVGGVHVLSATSFGSSCYDQDDGDGDGDGDEALIYRPDPINFRYADTKEENHDIEGIEIAHELLSSGQVVIHPQFGAGKGPNYQGPIAYSARWQNQQSGYNELLPDVDRQQAFSTHGHEQAGCSAKIKSLIAARREQIRAVNQDMKPLTITFGPPTPFVAGRRSVTSKSTTAATDARSSRSTDSHSSVPKPTATPPLKPTAFEPTERNVDDDLIYISTSPLKRKRLPSDPSTPSKRIKIEIVTPSKSQSKHPHLARSKVEVEVVDLTGEGDDELASSPKPVIRQHGHASVVFGAAAMKGKAAAEKGTLVVNVDEEEEQVEEENLLTWEQWVEDDHWWPEGC